MDSTPEIEDEQTRLWNGPSGQAWVDAQDVLERLALIALGRAAGFSLDEIAPMLGPDGRPRIDRKLLAAKADELDRVIIRLTAMRKGLRHAAACPAPSYMECPTFRRLLRSGATGAIGARRKSADEASRARRLR